MTRKHFEAIAEVLRKAKQRERENFPVVDRIIEGIIPVLRESNPLFKEKLFRQACYKEYAE